MAALYPSNLAKDNGNGMNCQPTMLTGGGGRMERGRHVQQFAG
jgi:hypothetical protein